MLSQLSCHFVKIVRLLWELFPDVVGGEYIVEIHVSSLYYQRHFQNFADRRQRPLPVLDFLGEWFDEPKKIQYTLFNLISLEM